MYEDNDVDDSHHLYEVGEQDDDDDDEVYEDEAELNDYDAQSSAATNGLPTGGAIIDHTDRTARRTTGPRRRRKVAQVDGAQRSIGVRGANAQEKRFPSLVCPQISSENCKPEDRFKLTNDCCTYCRGHNFCDSAYTFRATKGRCHPDANCLNRPFDLMADGTIVLLAATGGHLNSTSASAPSTSVGSSTSNELPDGSFNELADPITQTAEQANRGLSLDQMFECKCRDGFQGDGKRVCDDIDECKSHILNDCDRRTTKCTNTIGSYECKCKKGFKPAVDEVISHETSDNIVASGRNNRAKKCVDINECADGKLNRCHTHARCINTIGSYRCKCKRGFLGNGFECHKWFTAEPNVAAYLHRHKGGGAAKAADENRTSLSPEVQPSDSPHHTDRTLVTKPLSSVLNEYDDDDVVDDLEDEDEDDDDDALGDDNDVDEDESSYMFNSIVAPVDEGQLRARGDAGKGTSSNEIGPIAWKEASTMS